MNTLTYIQFEEGSICYYQFETNFSNMDFWTNSREISSLGVGGWLELYQLSIF